MRVHVWGRGMAYRSVKAFCFFFFFLAEWAAWRECEKVAGEGDK